MGLAMGTDGKRLVRGFLGPDSQSSSSDRRDGVALSLQGELGTEGRTERQYCSEDIAWTGKACLCSDPGGQAAPAAQGEARGVEAFGWGLRSSHCRAEETSPRRVSGTYYSSPGKAGISGLHSRLHRGVRPRLEGKPRTPLSSRASQGPDPHPPWLLSLLSAPRLPWPA